MDFDKIYKEPQDIHGDGLCQEHPLLTSIINQGIIMNNIKKNNDDNSMNISRNPIV